MCLLIPAPAGSVHSYRPQRVGRGSRVLWEEATLPASWETSRHPVEPLATEPPGEGLGSGPGPWGWGWEGRLLRRILRRDLSEENSIPLSLQTGPQGSGPGGLLKI